MIKREFTVANEHQYNRAGAIRWIISHVTRYPFFLSLFIGATLVSNGLYSLIPRLTGRAFDAVLHPAPEYSTLLYISLQILAVVLIQGIIYLSGNLSVEVLGQRLERDTRDELYLSLLGKSQTFHNRQRVGDIMARAANDVRQLNLMMNPGIFLILDSFSGLFIPIIAMGLIKIDLLLTPLIFTGVFFWALRRYNRELNPVSWRQRERFGILNAGLAETVSGIEVVKSASQEIQEKGKFFENARQYRNSFVQEGQVQARYLPTLLLGLAMAGAFIHGLLLFSWGQLTIGDLVAYMALMGLLRFPALISIFTFSLVQLGVAGAERILELLREETELDENESGYQGQMQGEIVFKNVTFGYGATPILKNLSFRAAPGQTIAIVGQTGSGKTTLTQLVNRTYDTNEGQILVDGIDVRQWNLASLRSQISIIEQDIFLFSRSIAENIGFGLGQKMDQAAIEQAAKEAQAHSFITSFKDGYNTVIGERGVTLSGGQRQRLAIARALLTDPRILILDDSTSAIDSATEDEIQKAIRRVLQGRTTLLITHRLSQIRWADQVLVLRRGELVDQGTHTELMGRCELYRRIFVRYETIVPA